MRNKPRFGIIPAGGLGTRFLPASGAVPKELFPVFDTPLIAFAIEEMAQAGVEKVFVVVSPWKKPLFERYLGIAQELEDRLASQGKTDILQRLNAMKDWPEVVLVEQTNPQGLAQAVGLCRQQIGAESFYVLLPDEVLLSQKTPLPLSLLGQSMEQTGLSSVGLFEVPLAEVKNYGVAKGTKLNASKNLELYQLETLVEKPKPEEAPSRLMLPGRYALNESFWSALENDLQQLKQIKAYGEVHMTEALNRMSQAGKLVGVELTNHVRYDVGRPQGFLSLNLDWAKQKGEAWLS